LSILISAKAAGNNWAFAARKCLGWNCTTRQQFLQDRVDGEFSSTSRLTSSPAAAAEDTVCCARAENAAARSGTALCSAALLFAFESEVHPPQLTRRWRIQFNPSIAAWFSSL